MTERLTTPSDPASPGALRTQEVVNVRDVRAKRPWDRAYVDLPKDDRVGIACSGGGIRSASYCLGALQELRRSGVLGRADYLSCVSGGGYISIAHAIMIDQTLKGSEDDGILPLDRLFEGLPPWAGGSPEEQHLREHLDYLAPGLLGRVWGALNALYGLVKHLIPFLVVLFIASYLLGLGYSRWVGPTLRDEGQHLSMGDLWPFAILSIALFLVALILLYWRQHVERGDRPGELALSTLQGWTLVVAAMAIASAWFLLAMPLILVWLHTKPFGLEATGGVWTLTGLAAIWARVSTYLAKHGFVKRLLPKLVPLITPILIIGPLIGLTYWCTQSALPNNVYPWGSKRAWFEDLWARPQTKLIIASLVLLIVYRYLDDVVSVPHLYYRERLAVAFVGRRRLHDPGEIRYEQPLWSEPIRCSDMDTGQIGPASFPRLVVCATANLSHDVPRGRAGAPFTFERDYCGGPVIGYVPTQTMEELAVSDALTMPALMAISGAAVAPSMGKMTRPAWRFLMALFDVRLGVWLPNPYRIPDPLTASRVRAERAARPGDQEGPAPLAIPDDVRARFQKRKWRPGSGYVLREAFGLNSLRRRFVYTTDGGHFDNLGLVELLRRGCGVIVCLDAAGDDLQHFNTLSEAIALARAELGVEISITVKELEPGDDGFSPSDHVVGTIAYPDGTTGHLIFCKAAMPEDAPQDVRAYREIDSRFPTHPTTDQFFNERTFESYRALGALAGRHAASELPGLLPPVPVSPDPGL